MELTSLKFCVMSLFLLTDILNKESIDLSVNSKVKLALLDFKYSIWAEISIEIKWGASS